MSWLRSEKRCSEARERRDSPLALPSPKRNALSEVDFRFRSLHWFRLFVPSFIRQFDEVIRGGRMELKRQLEGAP
jgi:hypothetical protein